MTMAENSSMHRRLIPGLWGLWLVVSVAPLLAYASPLWNNILADTPIADLIWIPIIAFGWIVWNITLVHDDAPDDNDLNIILGTVLAVMTGFALVLVPQRWPAFFVYNHGGLLFWPPWILAMVWLFWGLPATRRILAPLVYLLLVWPPIFQDISGSAQTILVGWAVGFLTAFSHTVHWLSPATPAGTFAVMYHNHPFLVVVAQACSGADSLLGSAIIIPALWFMFKGSVLSKMWLSLIALASALVLNWIRLAIVVLAVHIIGPDVTFTYIHPMIGFVLFGLLAVFLVLLMRPFGIKLPGRLSSSVSLRVLPGLGRVGIAVVIAGASLSFLWPMFSLSSGSFGNPSPLSKYSIRSSLPPLAGFNRIPVYYANESSVLGPDSATQADMYSASTGLGQTLLEMWSTPNAAALTTYGFHACLLYHGDTFKAVTSFQLRPEVVATAYAVELPPSHIGGARTTYVDVEWNTAVMVHGHVHYIRWSIAAFPQSAPKPTVAASDNVRLSSLSPIQAMVAPASQGSWTKTTLQTRNTLIDLAQQIYAKSSGASSL